MDFGLWLYHRLLAVWARYRHNEPDARSAIARDLRKLARDIERADWKEREYP